ncbi:hypothetical protein EP47_09570 [Legionella norrlandica]|uniref:Uncharacterized protein n=1 Tax=Legionella norrlandica TaxID=1498499 RepID=A0A0A2T7S4_9GAMM|nr:hypothetical protein [Legionella norrlandica]KGP63448.1 hypothetical protein EP47_09570 [Legionella norrlandica]
MHGKKDIIKLHAKDKKQIVSYLAEGRRKEAIKLFTELSLKKTDLTPGHKIKLVELNQENRLGILKQVMIHTLENLFKKKPDEFFKTTYHYDWWAFPMHVPLEWNWPKRNYDASINLREAQTLLEDDEFVSAYLECITLYLEALKKHGWNDYPVRYARMIHSLSLFIKAASTVDQKGVIKEKTIYQRLSQKGEEIIDFAHTNLAEKYSDYSLFTKGMETLAQEIKKFKEFAEEQPRESNPLSYA